MFVKETTNPTELREIATGLGLVWIGKSNADLAKEINEAMETKMNQASQDKSDQTIEEKVEVVEEAMGTEAVEEIVEEAETQKEAEEVIESVVDEVVEVDQIKPVEKVTKKSSGKWYDQEGAYPYIKGQKIEIIHMNNEKYNFLVGRTAIINGPSAKRNATKAQLVNPSTGKLQKTNVTFNFNEFKVIEENKDQTTDQEIV